MTTKGTTFILYFNDNINPDATRKRVASVDPGNTKSTYQLNPDGV